MLLWLENAGLSRNVLVSFALPGICLHVDLGDYAGNLKNRKINYQEKMVLC